MSLLGQAFRIVVQKVLTSYYVDSVIAYVGFNHVRLVQSFYVTALFKYHGMLLFLLVIENVNYFSFVSDKRILKYIQIYIYSSEDYLNKRRIVY